MRATTTVTAGVAGLASVVLVAGVAAVLFGGPAGSGESARHEAEAVLPATESDARPPEFDGRLYADPETGCLTLRPPPDTSDGTRGWIFGPVPDDRGRSVQFSPPDERWQYPDAERGPWPACPHSGRDSDADTG